MSTFIYFTGNVISLLFFARLSNYLGRKPVIITTIIFAIIGCISFVYVNGSNLFLIGRFLQGLSCGMSAGCIQTFILDTAPPNSNLGVIMSTNIPLIGFSIGALNSASIVDNNPSLISNIFILIIILLLICIFGILVSQETITRKSGVLSSIKPEVKVPNNIIRFIPISIIIFVSTYTISGFYQSFSSSMALLNFGFNSKLIAAVIYTSIIAPQIIGSTLINRLSIKDAQRYGIIGFTIALIFVNIALIKSYFTLFLTCNIIASLFCGLCFTSCMNNIVYRTKKEDMAGVLATTYIITDGGTALTNLLISGLVIHTTVSNVALIYLGFVIIACILTFILTGKINYDFD
ncbi:MFS transporter [Methanosphaera sp.]